jgi:hypothetical protein
VVTLGSGDDSTTLFRAARQSGAQIRHLEVSRQSLEQAFMRLLEVEEARP